MRWRAHHNWRGCQLLDNPWALLFLGVVVPTVLYVIWGVMEIVGLPIAK